MMIDVDVIWLIVHGAKAFLILVSLITYCCVSRHYVYRQRDEIVNEQYLVEEIYDRELRQAEQWDREGSEQRMVLIDCSSSSSNSSSDELSSSE